MNATTIPHVGLPGGGGGDLPPEMLPMPTWPASLPFPDRDGYEYAMGFGLVRTQFAGGAIRQRRTVWGMPAAFSLSFRMNTTQLATLQQFLDAHGYGWFAMDLVTGAARIQRPRSDCIMHRVRFTSDPTHQMIAPNLWRVTLGAEVESMRDPRADQTTGIAFATVDAVTPETVDELGDWDTLAL